MIILKKFYIVNIIIILAIILTSCDSHRIGKWYRINSGANGINEIVISNQEEDGFYLTSECINGANLGFFEGQFTYISKNTATYSGESYSGNDYVITVVFNDDIMKIDINHDENVSEWSLLDFGHLVTLSGEYSQEKPIYDYTELVLEKVFDGDNKLASSVRDYLGAEKYESFIYDFGMSTFINEEEKNGYKIIIGSLRGIGNWCAFCSTYDGFFYGINNYEYFSNDPIYKDNPPDFLNNYIRL